MLPVANFELPQRDLLHWELELATGNIFTLATIKKARNQPVPGLPDSVGDVARAIPRGRGA